MTPLHLQPALRFLGYERGRRCPRPSARAAREPRAADVGGHRRGTQERVVSVDPRGVRGQARVTFPINRHRLWQLAVDAVLVVRGLVPRVPPPLRPADPAVLPHAVHADDLDRRPDPARRLRPLRLLQPLVALRLDARHVGRGPRSHRRLPRLQRRRLLRQPRRPGAPAALGRDHGLAPPARLRRRRADARTNADGTPERARPRRARQGGGDRRCRRRRPADRQGDAEELRRSATRRSASIDDDPRKKNLRLHNVRVLGTTDELRRILADYRPDEVLIAIPSGSGDGAPAGRGHHARGGRAR